MKKIFSILFLGFTLTVSSLSAQTNFRNIQFDEALKLSKAENKLVFIDFYTDWCGPCRKMAREVFPQKEVGNYFNSHFVCVKYNAEKEGKELAKKFAIKAYPTFIIADSDGNEKARITGASTADGFITKVKNELNPNLTPEKMKQRYESGERTPELVDAYAMSFMEQKKVKEGYKIIDDYFNSLSDKQKLAKENFFIYSRYTFNVKDLKFVFLKQNVAKIDPEVKEAAMEYVNKLLHSELATYMSGFVFEEKKYNEESYDSLKNEIKTLGLDKSYPYAPAFQLVECYAKGDKKAYFELFKSKKSELDSKDFELILLNFSRLFADAPDVMPEVVTYVRECLPELRGSSIMMIGRVLMNIEKK